MRFLGVDPIATPTRHTKQSVSVGAPGLRICLTSKTLMSALIAHTAREYF